MKMYVFSDWNLALVVILCSGIATVLFIVLIALVSKKSVDKTLKNRKLLVLTVCFVITLVTFWVGQYKISKIEDYYWKIVNEAISDDSLVGIRVDQDILGYPGEIRSVSSRSGGEKVVWRPDYIEISGEIQVRIGADSSYTTSDNTNKDTASAFASEMLDIYYLAGSDFNIKYNEYVDYNGRIITFNILSADEL